eukprot:scaffold142446_cov32-Tisochrysis_lutea.AAC.2
MKIDPCSGIARPRGTGQTLRHTARPPITGACRTSVIPSSERSNSAGAYSGAYAASMHSGLARGSVVLGMIAVSTASVVRAAVALCSPRRAPHQPSYPRPHGALSRCHAPSGHAEDDASIEGPYTQRCRLISGRSASRCKGAEGEADAPSGTRGCGVIQREGQAGKTRRDVRVEMPHAHPPATSAAPSIGPARDATPTSARADRTT